VRNDTFFIMNVAQSGYPLPKNSQHKTWTLIAVSVSSFLLLAIILVGIYITKMKRNQNKNRQMLLGILSGTGLPQLKLGLWRHRIEIKVFLLFSVSFPHISILARR
jgi:hypothetical protein